MMPRDDSNPLKRPQDLPKHPGASAAAPAEQQPGAGRYAAAVQAAQSGNTDELKRYFVDTYAELRRLAATLMLDESAAHTKQPTDVVNDVFERLSRRSRPLPADHAARFKLMAKVMRNLLKDHARAKKSKKRGGGRTRLQLTDDISAPDTAPDALLELDPHIKWLEQAHPDLHEVVMLHFYAGLTHAEVAGVLRVSERTIIRRWEAARDKLQLRMAAETTPPD